MPRSEYYQKNAAHFNAYQKKWAAENREKIRQQAKERARRQRQEVLTLYGGRCVCCGESRFEFLAIDHINGGGTKERKQFVNQERFLKFIKENFTPEKYQVLCHNCNSAKGYYGYCPHKAGMVERQTQQS